MPYDPQRSRHRPEPTPDEPAPVDALLSGAVEPPLPEGVEVEVTDGGEVVVHTAEADVEITPAGDDVVIRTDDATVEIRADQDAVIVSTGDEDVMVDTSPRTPADVEALLDAEMASASAGDRRARLVLVAIVAAVVAAVVAALVRARRRD
jgi:hypothetical protein